MKKYCLTILMLFWLCGIGFAQNTSTSEAFSVAQSFMSKKGVRLSDTHSTTRGSVDYEIFNGDDGKGFVIVCNGAVVGYSTEHSAGDDMPDALKDMLESYGKHPAASRRVLPGWFTPRDVEPILPMITSHWNQTSPYNDSLSQKSGICVTIAHSQVAHYYRPGMTYFGLRDIPVTTFNHDLILDKYDYTSSTESRQEVARFVRYCNRIFGGELDTERFFRMKRHKYGKTTLATYFPSSYKGIVHSTYEFLDSCLESRTPVIAYGSNDADEGHCFIVDGRDSEGLYHMNWGWGGYYDGHFAISDAFDDVRTNSMFTIHTFILLGFIDEASAIMPIRQNISENCAIFNLAGQKVDTSYKGIVIQNGKKRISR